MARRALIEEEHTMRAAGEAKDRFLAALSHELRTPLTPIVLALDALLQRGEVPPSIEPTLRMVQRNVEQEARLIDDLLDVTRIAHDKLRCESAIVDVHALLREIHAAFVQEATTKAIEFHIDLAGDGRHVLGDAVRLRQVISNLLRNAIRHTAADGHIALTSSTPLPGTIHIRVTDTGSGIPESSLERIFVPFEQVDRTHGVGLGLGLAIAKGLVEQHGGRIGAASEGPGKGSTFTVELPTVPAPADQDDPGPAVPDRPTDETSLLLVEDHRDSAEALELGLSSVGYKVIVADSVRAALARTDGEFDVLVSDLSLPDGSGLDLIRALLLRSPVIGIALSGFGSAHDVEASLAAGFQRHLVKPVDLRVLVDTIETLLRPLGSPRTA
jgi:CheY-like chemotaxis protein/two-component sensor histidine kinase